MPIRLPFGALWLLKRDFIGESILEGGFEIPETRFASQLLKPGMTVLDIGANQGFHTLLFSKRVGRQGRVLAFEPSRADFKRLKLHLAINFCSNVQLFDCAVGEVNGTADFYAVRENSVLNSLRPPDTELKITANSVPVKRLDNILSESGLAQIDFVKIDVEGGELAVLKGARSLLEREYRPIILCEVIEMRTRPWGYPGRSVIEFLDQSGFKWFDLSADGTLAPLDLGSAEFNGNFVAVPQERSSDVYSLLKSGFADAPSTGGK
jgi:FkbM family methyltransferase